jgi:lipopolysaccharide transport system ATP-binding protein
LAVGDAEFQKKCLGKMRDVSEREGRTVLFVSHNLAAVADLTSRVIVLNSGTIIADGPKDEAITRYLSQTSNKTIYEFERVEDITIPHFKHIEVITSEPNGIHQANRGLEVRILISHVQPMVQGCLSLHIVNRFQNNIVHARAYNPEIKYGNVSGETLLSCRFPSLKLNVGHYHLRVGLTEPPGGKIYEDLDELCPFEVVRIEDTILWGWDPSFCTYFEESVWTVDS